MLRELFEEHRTLLNRFFDRIDSSQVERVLEKILRCKGVVLLTGVGKSGYIAQKIATTFSSTGTRALFLSPADALHGDIGFVSQEDLFLFFSKSGESEELLGLLPHVKKRGSCIIGCVSEPDSRLAQSADLTVVLPIDKELCPHDLAPTTSTAAQLIFGDCLAVGLMRAKRFSRSDFVANHPAGFLGKKMTLTVSDLMLQGKEIPLARPHQTLLETLHELSVKRSGCLLVVDEEMQLLGIFTDGDLRRTIESMGPGFLQCQLGSIMTRSPQKVGPEVLAFDAMRQMEADPNRPITVLPVVRGEQVVGLLRMHDILQAGLH